MTICALRESENSSESIVTLTPSSLLGLKAEQQVAVLYQHVTCQLKANAKKKNGQGRIEEEETHVIRANWKQDGGGGAELARPARKS